MEALNEKIWKNKKLIPEIKEKLLMVARKLVTDLDIDVTVKSVLFTGSLASFVWRASSDIDLHLIVDPVGNYDEVADEYLNMFSKTFNDYHNIFIKGYRLEVNIKREEKILDNKGIFNVLTNDWIQFPTLPSREMTQDEEVKDLVIDYQDKIDELINGDAPLEDVDSLRKEIKAMRVSGLAEDGEFSTGNLVFKELRYSEYIEKLYDFKREKEDEFLSFESFGGFFNRGIS